MVNCTIIDYRRQAPVLGKSAQVAILSQVKSKPKMSMEESTVSFQARDAGADVVFEGAGGSSGTGLRQTLFASFHAQHAEKAGRFLAELMSEVDAEARSSVIGNERAIVATAIELALRGFTEGGGIGLSFEQMLRMKLSEILRTSYNVKVAVYRAYRSASGARKGPSHEDQLLRNAELVDAVDVARENAELRTLVLEQTRTLLGAMFPAEAFCVEDREDLKVNARQISDLVDNFYLWFLEQMGERERLVGYLYVFGGLDARAVVEKVKAFEEKDFAPKEGEEPPEGEELMGSYGLDAATVEATYGKIKVAFKTAGAAYLEKFLTEVSLQDTDSLDLIRNWGVIRRHRDKVFAPVKNDPGEKREREPPMELSAMNLDRVEKMQIAIPETEWAICLEELNLMRLQRGNLSARNKVLMRISRLIGSMCRKGYARYWLKKSGLSDAVLDLQQELSVVMMEKMAMYDPTKSRLSTYMGRWIKVALDRAMQREAVVTLPSWVHDVLQYCRRHPDLSDEEVVAYFNKHGLDVSLKTVTRLRSSNFTMLDLDAPVVRHDSKGDGKGKGTIGDLLLVSKVGAQNLPAAMQAYRMSIVHRLLAELPPRSAHVLVQRYIYGQELEEIADEVGVSRQAIEQAELYALESLRAHTEMEDLKDDRTVQKGTRQRKADKVDTHPEHQVFLIFDQAKWDEWSAGQRDVSDEQMLWFRLYLGLEASNAFGRLRPGLIRKYRGETGRQFELAEFYRVIRLLRDRLQRDLAALPEDERFVRSFTRYEMFANAGALLDSLQVAA